MIYVADSAFATKENLAKAAEMALGFLTRLPESFEAALVAKRLAWEEDRCGQGSAAGVAISHNSPSPQRSRAVRCSAARSMGPIAPQTVRISFARLALVRSG
jgi:hypothetical protein